MISPPILTIDGSEVALRRVNGEEEDVGVGQGDAGNE